MNDSLKEIIKEVIKDFFIITVAMLFVVSLANSIALIEYYPPYFPWVVMGTGAVTSIPTLLFTLKKNPPNCRLAYELSFISALFRQLL